MLKEFKEFALKGNLVDVAIAFVMGAAFGKVVTTFVQNIFSPFVGLLLGGTDLSDKKYILREGTAEVVDASGAITSPAISELAVEWGIFIMASIDFIVVAFIMFLIIRAMNKMKKEEPAVEAGPTTESLLSDILNELKKG